MFQRQRRLCPRKWVLLFPSLFISLFQPTLSIAQVDTLVVTFNSTTIDDPALYRGLQADFPNPVISVITIQDQDGRYIHGLADKTKWLSPTDSTELGILVDSVWSVILEYHQEDIFIPENPDVKQMLPDYLVTELYDVEGFGISVALAMDYSGSMGDDIYISEDAARMFVREMSPYDSTAIVKFTGKVNVFETFTNDTTLLLDAIAEPTDDREYTAVYDAVFKSLELCQGQSGRRVVVAYTDGKDNNSSHDIDDVIALAAAEEIPVFMIGLGAGVEEVALQRISDETGGVYMAAESADDLINIYRKIRSLVGGYYLLAHTTTDPFYNGTWRIVDVTLNHDTTDGRGQGLYYVPFVPTDQSVFKWATTDSTAVGTGGLAFYALTGDSIQYRITVMNRAFVPAKDIRIVDTPHDSLEIVRINPEPTIQTPDSLVWDVPRLDGGGIFVITYTGLVDTLNMPGPTPLTNHVRVYCSSDTTGSNDTDSTTVIYIPLKGPDVALYKTGVGDSVAVSEGDSTWWVHPGNTVTYTVVAENVGELPCVNVQMQEILPPELTLIDFADGPYELRNDSLLTWTIDYLASRGGKRTYRYTCRVDTSVPPWDLPLVNRVTSTCPEDTIDSNSSTSDTVWVVGIVPPDPKIRLDPVIVKSGDGVRVDVYSPIPVVSWDLVVRFDRGDSTDTYADPFIAVTDLTPMSWIRIDPDFGDTWIDADDAFEEATVILRTSDQWGASYSASADFLIQNVYPQVRVTPETVEPGDSVIVEVMTPIRLDSWDVHVVYGDGSVMTTYADAFIEATDLPKDSWISVIPQFSETWMTVNQAVEGVAVILETTDPAGFVRLDTAAFNIRNVYPEIRLSPALVTPGDSVLVEVMTPSIVETWDLRVHYADGSEVIDYADPFIRATQLIPDLWTTVIPRLSDTWMRSMNDQEEASVVLETTTAWGIVRGDTASFTIRSTNEFFLDENTYRPRGGVTLGLRFKLSSNRPATIRIYDISGAFVKTIIDGPYLAGSHHTTWDGTDENGKSVGSGIYVAVLTSPGFVSSQKFILVR